MNIHVLTPFSRPHLLNDLLALYVPQNIQWHLLAHDIGPLNYTLPNWVSIHRCDNPPKGWEMYWKLNWWIANQGQIVDTDRYGVLCDDDGCDPEYFQKIRNAGPDVPVVMTQCELGRRKHGRQKKSIWHMRAEPEQMRPGCVGCQFWVLGKVWRNVAFPTGASAGYSADGVMASKLARENETLYLPEASRWYNWLAK